MPSSIVVAGRKPTAFSSSLTSAIVDDTSPGCIGSRSIFAFRPSASLEDGDVVEKLHRLVVADVEDAIRRVAAWPDRDHRRSSAGSGAARLVENAHDAFDDVVDVREVADHLALR